MFGKYRLSAGRLFSDDLESGRLQNTRKNIIKLISRHVKERSHSVFGCDERYSHAEIHGEKHAPG